MPRVAAETMEEEEERSMTQSDLTAARGIFAQAIAAATTADAAYAALHGFVAALAPARLFTITLTDMAAGVARRAFSSDAVAYPVSGTKPINHDGWFNVIHIERRIYVENDLARDLEHFSDYDLIKSLGCEAAMNVPVILADDLVGTVNILDAKDSYDAAVVARVTQELQIPAMLAFAVAQRLRA